MAHLTGEEVREMQYQFIWKIDGKEVFREPAKNCYARNIQNKKQDLAIEYNCQFVDVELVYEPINGTQN